MKMNVPGPDLSVWRPWAGSLLEAPTHPQMQYNLHALTIVIISIHIQVYIYISIFTFTLCKIYKSEQEE